MGLFGKKRVDTIDFTKMRDARVIKPSGSVKMEGDCVDLREQDSGVAPQQESQPASSGGSMMDFLSSSSTVSTNSSDSFGSSSNPVTQISEISELKNRLRNMTSQMENFSNDNYKLMQRIELLERKLERMGA